MAKAVRLYPKGIDFWIFLLMWILLGRPMGHWDARPAMVETPRPRSIII